MPDQDVVDRQVRRQLIKDLKVIATTPIESLERLNHRLAEQTVVLTSEKLTSLIAEEFSDEATRFSIARALQGLTAGNLGQLLVTVRSWRSANDRNSNRFPQELYQEIVRKLPVLI